MANLLYDQFRQKAGTALVNLTTDTIQAYLVTATYAPTQATDVATSAFSAAIVTGGGAQTVTGQYLTNGVWGHNAVTWPSVTTSQTAKAIVYFDVTANCIIAYIDSDTGQPLTTSGNNVVYTPAVVGSGGVFKL